MLCRWHGGHASTVRALCILWHPQHRVAARHWAEKGGGWAHCIYRFGFTNLCVKHVECVKQVEIKGEWAHCSSLKSRVCQAGKGGE